MKTATLPQAVDLLQLFGGASKHALERLLRHRGMMKDLIEAAEKREGDNHMEEKNRWDFRERMNLQRYPQPDVFEVPVNVDPMIAPAVMLERGDYGHVYDQLHKAVVDGTLARSRRQGRVNISVLHFDRNLAAHGESKLTIEQEVAAIEKGLGFEGRYRAVTIDEVLALGAQKPDLQKKFPLVAQGLLRQGTDHHGHEHTYNIVLDQNVANKPNTRRLSEYNFKDSCCYAHYRIIAVKLTDHDD